MRVNVDICAAPIAWHWRQQTFCNGSMNHVVSTHPELVLVSPTIRNCGSVLFSFRLFFSGAIVCAVIVDFCEAVFTNICFSALLAFTKQPIAHCRMGVKISPWFLLSALKTDFHDFLRPCVLLAYQGKLIIKRDVVVLEGVASRRGAAGSRRRPRVLELTHRLQHGDALL
jgi:hypothetical protein